ncbi:MAG TPA: N,N-dimethylformamidase beta subunit family domain-containing protein [Noviherbaspirillum sp.]|nr:N,N-dimethylformamidase beta subunit family domain-containing protein [Noviherbaspirillum sp.]
MIRGYPHQASVFPGEQLILHIATDAPRFRIAFHRWADGLIPVHETNWLEGQQAAPRGAADDWQWPQYTFDIPEHWPSAVYIAHLQEPDGILLSLAMTSAAVLFVVRGTGRSKLLYKIPLATYHAYNCTGGGCFYTGQTFSNDPPGARVSLHRPGGGIGGDTWGALDHYDLGSPRQTFAHWDARFIRWLLREGYSPEVCTDFDIHRDPDLLGRYRLVLSVGHDEYWSETTRDRMEDFVSAGGNLAFFGANLCWWRIHVVDGGSAIVCHQGGPKGALDHWWPVTGAARPEDALTGVSYRHGGGWWDGPRETSGYIVQDDRHWVFEGTGLRNGQSLGRDTSPPVVGYECDGAPLDVFDAGAGIATLSRDAARCGTPPGFRLLAAGLLGPGWQERPPREMHKAEEGIHAATMGIFSRNGIVFTAGTTDWAQVLGQDARVDRITRNVIDRLLQPSSHSTRPANR